MNGKILVSSLLVVAATVAGSAMASGGETEHPKQLVWSFDGMFGHVDKQSAQRGYQVYKQVCASCHSMKGLSYRNLQEIGFSEAEVKAIAAEAQVTDGPNDAGDMFQRPGRASDRFAAPFANDKAARASNNGALPPDLTLMAKARHDGPNYVYSLLTGYSTPPSDFHLNDGMNYNPYFPGRQIAMPPPLSEGAVTYQDGTAATVDQMARDVVNYLEWAAEPEMEHRKLMGLKVLGFLAITAVFMYVAMGRVWSKLDK